MSRYLVSSPQGLVQVLGANLLNKGYRFYVTGCIANGKNPAEVDAKLIQKYGLDLSKEQRARRKRAGYANVRYLRCGRFFVMVATDKGTHPWFRAERNVIRDARIHPIRYGGYAISVKKGPDRGTKGQPRHEYRWHARVSLDRETYNNLKAYFLDLALHRSADYLRREFGSIPYEPWAPVRLQLVSLLNAVNRVRKRAGYEKIPHDVLRYHRQIVKVFVEPDAAKAA